MSLWKEIDALLSVEATAVLKYDTEKLTQALAEYLPRMRMSERDALLRSLLIALKNARSLRNVDPDDAE